MIRRACAWCRSMHPMRRQQRYCSHACAQRGVAIRRTDYVRVGRLAGTVSGARARERAEARWQARAERMAPWEAFRAGYQAGYKAAARKRRAALSEGKAR